MEAIEASFVPLCIYNNTRADHDDEIRKRYKEPAWNNPVVRIVSPETGKDLVEPVRTDWSAKALLAAMEEALRSVGREER